MQVTDWFCGKLHYEFDPAVHGTASEWLSDLVSISFTEQPAHFKRSMRTMKVSADIWICHIESFKLFCLRMWFLHCLA